jgi:hypothetical protein
MRLVGQSAECLVLNTVFSFYCAIGEAIWKIACSNIHIGWEEILLAYLAQTKIIAFGNKRQNVLENCVADYTQDYTFRFMHTSQHIVAV